MVHLGARSLGELAATIRSADSLDLGILQLNASAFLAVAVNGRYHFAPLTSAGTSDALLETLHAASLQGRIYGFGIAVDDKAWKVLGLDAARIWDGQVAVRVVRAGLVSPSAEPDPDGVLPSMMCHGCTRQDREILARPERLDSGGVADGRQALARAVSSMRHAAHVVRHVFDDAKALSVESTAALELAVRPIVAQIASQGIGVDADGWRTLITQRTGEKETAGRAASVVLGIDPRSLDDTSVAHRLRQYGRQVDSVNNRMLRLHADVPGVKSFGEFRRARDFLERNGKDVLTAIERSPDGRVRGVWNPLGTKTGRITCSAPPLCGIEKDSQVRRLFIPAPGFRFVVGDYEQAQLRIAAQLARDEVLINLLRSGCDIHAATASALLGKPVESITRSERDLAKPCNFGLLFGMGPDRFADYAFEKFDVKLSAEDATTIIERFRATYQGVHAWQQRVRLEMPSIMRSLGGRVCHFPSGEVGYTERLAAPIQGSEADGIKRALVLLAPELAKLGGHVVFVQYDSIVAEVPAAAATGALDRVRQSMIEGLQPLLPDVPVVVNAEVRTSWAG